jgi:DNA-binding NarL/FixJ family response regulator
VTFGHPRHRSRRRQILIVDDHPLMRRGLRELISQDDALEVSGEADSVDTALEQLDRVRPDLAIVDLTLADGSGLDLIESIRERDPSIASLVWSMHDERLFSERALRAGAKGFVSKTASADELVGAIHSVLGKPAVDSDPRPDRHRH